jgi:hypothetical protein
VAARASAGSILMAVGDLIRIIKHEAVPGCGSF